MTLQALQDYVLAALIGISLILCFFVFKPFLVVLLLAAIFAVVLQPVHRRISRLMKGLPSLAALSTILVAVVGILVPLTFLGLQILQEAERLYVSVATDQSNPLLSVVLPKVNDVLAQYAPSFAVSEVELIASINHYSQETLAWLIHNLGGAFGGVARLFLNFFVFVIALYYLLRDGTRLKTLLTAASPLSDVDDEAIATRLEGAINSVIRGSLTIALLQGVLSSIGFAIFGVPNPILWGLVAALASLIPGIGTALVLTPAVAYLLIIGAPVPALGLFMWATVAVGMVDNFLGPRLMGKRMQLHPLLVLLSVLGGLAFFGAAGLFLGPLCVNLLFALVSIGHDKRSKTPL